MKYTLLTNVYHEPDPNRRAELVEAFHRNCASGVFSKIELVVEGDYPGNVREDYGIDDRFNEPGMRPLVEIWDKLPWKRLTYDDWFAHAKFGAKPRSSKRYVLANADIYFDESLRLLDSYDLTGVLVCLSRWNVSPDDAPPVLATSPLSQDAWIWEPPLPHLGCDWTLGELGCDSRVARKAAEADLTILNPCYSVKAYHLHLSGVRNYGKMRSDWYTYVGTPVPFCSLDDIPPTILPRRNDPSTSDPSVR